MGLKSWIARQIAHVGRRKLIFAALSVGITSIVITGFLIENRWGYMRPTPLLVFMDNWSLNRSGADVEAARAREKAEAARTTKATEQELVEIYQAQAQARAELAQEAAAQALDAQAIPSPAPSPPVKASAAKTAS